MVVGTFDPNPVWCFSSEDELDVLLNGTPEQKKKLIREYLTGESESSSGDEFEKEMEAELSSTIRSMEGTWRPPASGSNGGEGLSAGGAGGSGAARLYDKIYFDSDSEEEEDAPSEYEANTGVTMVSMDTVMVTCPLTVQVAPPAGGRDAESFPQMMSCCMTPMRTTGTRPGWTPGGDGKTRRESFIHKRARVCILPCVSL